MIIGLQHNHLRLAWVINSRVTKEFFADCFEKLWWEAIQNQAFFIGSLPFGFMRNHLHGHCVQIRLEAAEELTTALHFITHSHREDCGA